MYGRSNIESDDKHVYYNISIQNTSTTSVVPATFKEERTQSILSQGNEWKTAIIRFKCPTDYIPQFVFQLQPPPNPSNNGIYSVIIDFNGSSYQTYLRPNINYGIDTATSSPFYLYVWNIQSFLDSLNDAINRAFQALIAVAVFPGTHAPYMVYNNSTGRFSLIAEQGAWQPDNPAGGQLIFNDVLHKFFINMQSYTAVGSALGNQVYQMLIHNTGNNYYQVSATNPDPQGASGYTAWSMNQDNGSLGMWSQFETLVLLAGSMPIRFEYTPSNTSLQGVATGVNSTQPVLTDFEPVKSTSGIDHLPLQFQAQGPWRWVDLTQSTPLTKFDMSIYWQDRSGTLHPVLIGPGDYASIKFAFAKRGDLISGFK